MRLTLRQLRHVIRESVAGSVEGLAARVIESGDVEALQVLVDTLQERGDKRGTKLISRHAGERMTALLTFLPGKSYFATENGEGGLSFKFRGLQVTSRKDGTFHVALKDDYVGKISYMLLHAWFHEPTNEWPMSIGGILSMPNSASYVKRWFKWDGSWKESESLSGNINDEMPEYLALPQSEQFMQCWRPDLLKALPDLKALYEDTVPVVDRLLYLVNEIPMLFPETGRE